MKSILLGFLMILTGSTCFSQNNQDLIIPIAISGTLGGNDFYETLFKYSSTGAPDSIRIKGFEDRGGSIGICQGFGAPVNESIIVNGTFSGRPGSYSLDWLCPFEGWDSIELGWMKLTVEGGDENKFFAEIRHSNKATNKLKNLAIVPAIAPALDWQVMNGQRIGLVIVNPNSESVQVTIKNEEESCEYTVTLEPMERISKFVSELDLSCESAGYWRIVGDQPIAVSTVQVSNPIFGYHFYTLPSHIKSGTEE